MVQHSFVQNGAQKYNGGLSSLSWWFSTPQGTYVLDWELTQFDNAVDDVFGFRALQVGLPEIDFLRQNRIPYRFSLALEPGAALAADPLQLPLASQSVDLVGLRRFGFMEKMGPRWLWFAGAVYVVRAVKRVQGMRIVTPAWRRERARRRALAPMTQRSHKNHG